MFRHNELLEYYDKVMGPFLMSPSPTHDVKLKRYYNAFYSPEVDTILSEPTMQEWWKEIKTCRRTPWSVTLTDEHYKPLMILLFLEKILTTHDYRHAGISSWMNLSVQKRGDYIQVNLKLRESVFEHERCFKSTIAAHLYVFSHIRHLRNTEVYRKFTQLARTPYQAMCMLYCSKAYEPMPERMPLYETTYSFTPVQTEYEDFKLCPLRTVLFLHLVIPTEDSSVYQFYRDGKLSVMTFAVNEKDVLIRVQLWPSDIFETDQFSSSAIASFLLRRLHIPYDVTYIEHLQKWQSVTGAYNRMKYLYPPKALEHVPDNTRVEWPQIRMDFETGLVRYPIALPDELKTRILTKGQVITQEFMKKREVDEPFYSNLVYRLNERDLICPSSTRIFTRQPALDNPIRQISGGLIADQTGSGKTLSMIIRCLSGGPNLIVVPDTLLQHWMSEITKHTRLPLWAVEPEEKRKIPKVQSKNYGALAFRSVVHVRAMIWSETEPPKIVLINHTVLRSVDFRKAFENVRFRRLIVDEAHRFTDRKISNIKHVRRDFTWVITATPYENMVETQQLLQLNGLSEYVHGGSDAFIPALFRYWTVQNPLDTTHLKVEYAIHYATVSAEENDFFAELGTVIEEYLVHPGRYAQPVGRFFRILERLGAGGYLHKKLILQVLRANHVDLEVSTKLTLARQMSFSETSDDCSVCLEKFIRPVQMACRHVICSACYSGVKRLSIMACPQCRHRPIDPIHLPWFKNEPRQPEHEEAADSTYPSLLGGLTNPPPMDASEYIHLQGKTIELKNALSEYVKRRGASEQLVIFTKEEASAPIYLQLIHAVGLSTLCAGVLNTKKQSSIQNISKFREHGADVLLISNRYAFGFDLYMASELWMLNVDLSLATMEQAVGRVTRVAQKNAKVVIRVFLYPNMFDEWLWTVRKSIGSELHTRGHLWMFYYYLMRNRQGSLANRMQSEVAIMSQPHVRTLPVISKKSLLVFGDPIAVVVDLIRGEIRCGPRIRKFQILRFVA